MTGRETWKKKKKKGRVRKNVTIDTGNDRQNKVKKNEKKKCVSSCVWRDREWNSKESEGWST